MEDIPRLPPLILLVEVIVTLLEDVIAIALADLVSSKILLSIIHLRLQQVQLIQIIKERKSIISY